ncbi:epimerase family protein SDR39U1-like [Cimex lectularius]|uniref:Epimerase family protein SDR39U1 n=1 Tax=Cimex lectularius TaxID=79782 RepID=A0A8I6TE82_CIMLE|nr:epimerase family protein SDR39U1-like [Cimex lectularius]
MSIPGHVLIGGGSGFIGSALRHVLKSKGYDITVISRMPGPRRVTWFDICNSGLPSGVTVVVNLAGQNVLDPTQRWTPGFKQNVWNSRINTNLTLAQAINKAEVKPKVFAKISGVGIYKPDQELIYDETSSVGPSFDFLSKLAVEWEKAGELSPDLGVRSVTIRSGVVLGRHGGMIKQLLLPFFFCLGGPIGSGKQPMPWIHIKDLCNMFVFAIENDEVSGVLNGVAPQVVTNEDFTHAMSKALQRPAVFRVPEAVLNFLFSAERAKIMTSGQKVSPKRVQKFGFTYEYPNINDAVQSVTRLLHNKKEPF